MYQDITNLMYQKVKLYYHLKRSDRMELYTKFNRYYWQTRIGLLTCSRNAVPFSVPTLDNYV